MAMYIMLIEHKAAIYPNPFCKTRNKGNVIRKKKNKNRKQCKSNALKVQSTQEIKLDHLKFLNRRWSTSHSSVLLIVLHNCA